MGRNGWIIAAVAVVLILGSLAALTMLTGQASYQNMQGTTAVIKGPTPKNGFLGVGFTSDASGPATITHVVASSGAAEAGLQPGDVIIAVGDRKDPSSVAVQAATVNTTPGQTIALRIRHENGEEKDVSVRLISMEELLRLATIERQAGSALAAAAAAPTTRAATAPVPAPAN
jgi:S1-C subfamily serine protease